LFTSSKSILLGVTGGIAAYKACEIARHFVKNGIEVQTVLTENAAKFVTPLTFESLTGRPCFTSMFEPKSILDSGGSFKHIDFGAEFDVMLVAPATANIIAKFANGIADDLLSTTYLCFDGAVAIAPAMNTRMWQHPATLRNLERLKADGVEIIEPAHGKLACGEIGAGKLADVDTITAFVEKLLGRTGRWANLKVLVTTGATREDIDPIRFISNNSTGEFGRSVASWLVRFGAEVTLVEANPPANQAFHLPCKRIVVRTADEMHKATMQGADRCDFVFMLAAVSDFQPKSPSDEKVKKNAHSNGIEIALTPTKDILSELGMMKKRPKLVGVSAETSDVVANSLNKLAAKGVDAIFAVKIGRETPPFGANPVAGTVLFPDASAIEIPLSPKDDAAKTFVDIITSRFLSVRGD
jgi:phosphopantothenoylcysteine decarboxylase/phosphopantothenate--cysteine ligase